MVVMMGVSCFACGLTWGGETRRSKVIPTNFACGTQSASMTSNVVDNCALCCAPPCVEVYDGNGWWQWVVVMAGVPYFAFD